MIIVLPVVGSSGRTVPSACISSAAKGMQRMQGLHQRISRFRAGWQGCT